ncbi:MAG: Ger(x)C family spore germination C-terminal domain-containing protein [Christensenellaceae bacterium]|jgi:Ger(x)C family germination protein|nr:Ger(x)C family spore germination C-terminal domain-containing protein [Christensenellaceae bacterium]
MRRIVTILSIISFSLGAILLSSCSYLVEPQTLAVVSCALYDYDGEKFIVDYEIIAPAAAAKDSSLKLGERAGIIIHGDGDCVETAIANAGRQTERLIYSASCRARIFTERLARDRKAMSKMFDYLMRQPDFRETAVLFIVNENDIDKVFSADTGLTHLTGEYLMGLSDSQPKSESTAPFTTTLSFINAALSSGIEPVATYISFETKHDSAMEGSESGGNEAENSENAAAHFNLNSIALFKNCEMAGVLYENDALLINILRGDEKQHSLDAEDEDMLICFAFSKMKGKIKASEKDGKLDLKIVIKGQLNVNDVIFKTDEDVELSDLNDEIIEIAEKRLTEVFTKTIKELKKYDCDAIGSGNAIASQDYDKWMKIKKDGTHDFQDSNVHFEYDISFARIGELTTPFGKMSTETDTD